MRRRWLKRVGREAWKWAVELELCALPHGAKMQVPIIMPELGTPRAEMSIWFVDLGAKVEEGERLLEILAGAATVDLAAPTAGQLVRQCALPPDSVLPGQVLGYIEKS